MRLKVEVTNADMASACIGLYYCPIEAALCRLTGVYVWVGRQRTQFLTERGGVMRANLPTEAMQFISDYDNHKVVSVPLDFELEFQRGGSEW